MTRYLFLIVFVSLTASLNTACKKRKIAGPLLVDKQGLALDRLPGHWESPCYLSKENSFISYSKTVHLNFKDNKLARMETLWSDTACQKKLMSRVFTGTYNISDNFDKKHIYLDFSYDSVQVAIHDESYAKVKNKQTNATWKIGELKDIEMKFPNNVPLKGTRLYTVYYIDTKGMLHWGMPSQTAAARPKEATREIYTRELR